MLQAIELRNSRTAVFLDRDGVLIEEVGHLQHPDQVRLIPGAIEALLRLRAQGFLLIAVTNQSVVARGLMSEEDLEVIHRHLQNILAEAGARLDDILVCPHHPTEGVGRYRLACACRKPAPGMLLEAARRHQLSIRDSILIGDKGSDIAAAHRAGCHAVLVRTGHGETELARGLESECLPDEVCSDLYEACDYVVNVICRTPSI